MPEKHPQPFLFEEMAPPPIIKEPVEEVAGEKAESKEGAEGEEKFQIIKNTGFTLVIKVESPVYLERTYHYGRKITWSNEFGEGDYTNSPAYGWLDKAMDDKARKVFHDETSVDARKKRMQNRKRKKFVEGKFSENS